MSAKSQPQPTATDDKCLQSVPAVAKFLSLSRSKVYKLMDDGELPFVKLGKSRRIRWADVLKLVERNLVGAEE
jgi:excisionase family DNA binding protein